MSHTGVHINGAGSFKPTMGEVPPETVATRGWKSITANPDCLKPAYLVQAIRSGFISEDNFHAELGENAAGEKEGRTQRRKSLSLNRWATPCGIWRQGAGFYYGRKNLVGERRQYFNLRKFMNQEELA